MHVLASVYSRTWTILMAHDCYENPLITRYASPAMSQLWGARRRIEGWRRMWIILATALRELGVEISEQQIQQMRDHLHEIDFDSAQRYERQQRHDVMAHVHAFGDQCPDARPIIHLGATSCFVTDNTDLLLLREALQRIAQATAATILQLADFAIRHRDTACLGFTHLQPAQPTTMGKRACLWAYDLALDLEELERRLLGLRARSAKGTTGTQASFLELFGGDHDKVQRLERRVAELMGFSDSYVVTGQTYPRKVDSQILDVLSGLAQSGHKFACDVRLLSSRREVEEPFEEQQVGSSAMAYKRNPMRSERMCALARFVMSLQSSPANTAATQWLERTLDDSANRRLVLPQAFLAIDGMLALMRNIAAGMIVHQAIVGRLLREELPFMATENILMAAVAAGGDRQAVHERLRQHSVAAAAAWKAGGDNDLLQRLQTEPALASVDVQQVLEQGNFVGRAPQQVDQFIQDVVGPIRQRYGQAGQEAAPIRV